MQKPHWRVAFLHDEKAYSAASSAYVEALRQGHTEWRADQIAAAAGTAFIAAAKSIAIVEH
jgi:hypothetical protein